MMVNFDNAQFIALFLFVAAVAFCRSQDCPRDLPDTTSIKRFRDFCYQFVSREKYWYDARDYCSQYGGQLVKISDAETNGFVIQSLNELWWRNNGVWIGLHDTASEMQFRWTGHENEAVAWTNWGRGHPGASLHRFRDCVRMVRGSGDWKWHETPCNTMAWHYRFICQYKVAWNEVGQHLGLTGLRPESPVPRTFPDTTPIKKSSLSTPASESPGTESVTIRQPPDTGDLLREKSTEAEEAASTTELAITKENATDYDEYLLDEESVRLELVNQEQEEPAKGSDKGYMMALILFVVPICFFILAAYILYKRRTNKKTEANAVNLHFDGHSKLKEAEEESTKEQTSTAVSNIYVIPEVVKRPQRVVSSTLLNESERSFQVAAGPNGYDATATSGEGWPAVSEIETGEDVVDCGMMGYDIPKSSNPYAEIPDVGQYSSAEDHIYESLDDVVLKA